MTKSRHDRSKRTTRLRAGIVAVMLAAPASLAHAQLSFTTPSAAQGSAPRPLRAAGMALDPAIEAARAAIATCASKNFMVTAVVVDSQAVPIVILSGDGAAAITQSIAMGKAVSSVRLGMDSADIVKKIPTDPALAARAAADPEMGQQRPGGVLITAHGETLGAIGVSGTPSGYVDADCARAGMAKVTGRF